MGWLSKLGKFMPPGAPVSDSVIAASAGGALGGGVGAAMGGDDMVPGMLTGMAGGAGVMGIKGGIMQVVKMLRSRGLSDMEIKQFIEQNIAKEAAARAKHVEPLGIGRQYGPRPDPFGGMQNRQAGRDKLVALQQERARYMNDPQTLAEIDEEIAQLRQWNGS